jgi:hypothetical protein
MWIQTNFVKKVSGERFDVVGDVHGEFKEFQGLLNKLGYSELGENPNGRKAIFVGNLCGPDLKGVEVLLRVKKMVEAGNAFSILGKNELLLLRGNAKAGTGWFFDEARSLDQANARLDESQYKSVIDFLNSLPLIIECDDLRIADALWLDSEIEKIRAGSLLTVVELFEWAEAKICKCLKREGIGFAQTYSVTKQWRLYNVTSTDSSVGGRLAELREEFSAGQVSRLVALRWPEQKIVFENEVEAKLKFEFLNYAKTEALRKRSKEIRAQFKRPDSTLNLQEATAALLNECGYLFGKFQDSSASDIEVIAKNIQDYLQRDNRSFKRYESGFGREMLRERRRKEYRRWRGPLGKTEFENLKSEVQLKWVLHVKENYPEAAPSKRYDIAEMLYEKSPTELPELTRKSWVKKLVAIFR